MGRPKGSGKGLVSMTIRVDPDVYQALLARSQEGEKGLGAALRRVLRQVFEQDGSIDAISQETSGYRDGLRRASHDVKAALAALWEKE